MNHIGEVEVRGSLSHLPMAEGQGSTERGATVQKGGLGKVKVRSVRSLLSVCLTIVTTLSFLTILWDN